MEEKKQKMSEVPKESYVIALDFESRGGITPLHGFLQLGACLLDMNTGNVLATFNEFANQESYVPEERCMREFWDKHKDVYDFILGECEKSAFTPHDVVDHFIEWIQSFGDKLAHTVLISDNVSFDVAILRVFSLKQDIGYLIDKSCYGRILDVSDYYKGYSRQVVDAVFMDSKFSKKVIAEILEMEVPTFSAAKHDHMAHHDAQVIALRWHAYMCAVQTRIKQEEEARKKAEEEKEARKKAEEEKEVRASVPVHQDI